MTNSEITLAAREKLSGKWLPAILAFLIISILSSLQIFTKDFFSVPAEIPGAEELPKLFSPKWDFNAGSVLTILLGGALSFGGAAFSIYLVRGFKADIELIFTGFHDLKRFFVFLATNIIIIIFVVLWTLLLIIPGIIASLSYAMTFYILVDNPDMSSLDAISKSKELMKGHKWQLFKLWLRFIALGFLCIFTIGIGFLWLIPYANICTAQFYDSLLEE